MGGMGKSTDHIVGKEDQVLIPSELPASQQEIDLDRVVWDPDYRAAIKRLLNESDRDSVRRSRNGKSS